MPEACDKIDIAVRLDAPDWRDDHQLYAVLRSALKSRSPLPLVKAQAAQACWPAAHFKLDRVSLFQNSSAAEQQAIVQACGRNLLAEAYYIEKCGMYFAAKMSLLAATTPERMLYSLFAADEALHFNWIGQFISASQAQAFRHNPFITLIEEVLQCEDRTTLAYVVQVILEGWGIHHYQALARACLDRNLQQVFAAILQDEARHHVSGLMLFNEQSLSAMQIGNLVALLQRFFRLVQAGPQLTVSEIQRVKGTLSKAQKTAVFTELNGEAETANRLHLLKGLLNAAAFAEVMVTRLEAAAAFTPWCAADCAALCE
ncbi:MAG: ferritin-like domain-containing protein [Acidobacteria bacterium]|nr:ferritin-like domain-containing protein [Acidobacteriota bacterium]